MDWLMLLRPGRVAPGAVVGLVFFLAAWTGAASAGAAALTWQIRPKLDPLAPMLDGLEIEIHQTASPQISVHNRSGKPLLILDQGYQPFLRIGPGDVSADVANLVFHRSRYAGDDVPPPEYRPDSERWQRVSSVPTWAWFDPRLTTANLQLPAGPHFDLPVLVKRWAIPVRLGDAEGIISGYFLYHRAPTGMYLARLSGDGQVTPDVSVYPTAEEVPGLLIVNRGNEVFTVLGMEGEPFLHFLPGKVLVNQSSATWAVAAPTVSPVGYVADAGSEPSWVVISTTGSFGWIEPRAYYDGSTPASTNPVQVKQWQVPLLFADGRKVIEGTTQWLPGADAVN